jgi:hypothetical protein
MSKPGFPFPTKQACVLLGNTFNQFAGASIYRVSILANSIYHFDTVHNVYYSNALTAFYDQFLVDSAEFVVTVQNTSATVGLTAVLFPTLSTSTASLASALNQRDAVVLEVAPVNGSPSIVTKTIRTDLKRFFGLTNLSTTDVNYVGGIAVAAPAQVYYMGIVIGALDGTTNVTANIQVRCMYHTTLLQTVDAAP